MKYSYHESFKHKLAKELLHHWLWSIDKKLLLPFPNGIKLPFAWDEGNYGVFLELPFYETSDMYYFECSKGLLNASTGWGKDMNPTEWFDPNCDRGRILFVPDICIFHKGTPGVFIEVVHKNTVSVRKLKAIEKFFTVVRPSVWSIEAENILNQTNKFCNLIFKRLL